MSVIGLRKHSKDASYLQVIPDHETIFSHHTLCLSKAFYFANGTIQHREIRMIFFSKLRSYPTFDFLSTICIS